MLRRLRIENLVLIREAELEEMEKKWREQNAAIMNADPHPQPDPQVLPQPDDVVAQGPAEEMLPLPASKAEVLARNAEAQKSAAMAEPTLPFPKQ